MVPCSTWSRATDARTSAKTILRFEPHDVFVVPPWTSYYIVAEGECVLFSYSDRAAQEALGFWREEDPANRSAG